MFIDINKIHPDGVVVDDELRLPDLEGPSGEKLAVSGARIQARAVPGKRGVELTGRLTATVHLACSRCLETMPVDVASEFFLRLVPDAVEFAAGDAEVSEEDASLFYVEEGRADLRKVATEQIYLDLPLKPICSEDCRGLCPVCGANRNQTECGCEAETVDPRLAPLSRFKSR
jgi:uncharacterized protein